MSSEHIQMEILKDQLNEANAIVDFVRGELWARALDIWEARDCLYYALALIASCNSCKEGSLDWMKVRLQESDRVRDLVESLKQKDIQNSGLLADVGVDLATWAPVKQCKGSFK
jgi:hypothetical protein